ncbi:MAG: transglycosylase domain-containing protein [Rikenellaceae bacterium]
MNRTKSSGSNRKKIAITLWVIAATPFVLLALMLALTAVGAFGKLPSFAELENPKSNLATEIYSSDGKLIGSYFIENRSFVQYEELFPVDESMHLTLNGEQQAMPHLVAALIATEDLRFHSHGGIDVPALLRVAIKTIAMQDQSQGGGSTITQQVAKSLFPRDETIGLNPIEKVLKLVITKFKEWITSIKLEYNYTKDEIAAMYLNVVNYGSNAYGIKSAAQTFFNKEPHELSIEQAALMIGVVNAPTRYSPVINPERSLTRRNTVLNRMATTGAITAAQADSLKAIPITLDYKPISHNSGEATYFREMLRLTLNAEPPKRRNYYTEWDYKVALEQYNSNPVYGWCKKNQRSDGGNYDIYRDGLKIYTTINSTMQAAAEEALLHQMKNTIQPALDAQQRRTGKLFIEADKEQTEKIIHSAILASPRYYNMKHGGCSHEEIMASFDKKVPMRIFTYSGDKQVEMTPRDSIKHYKGLMRGSIVAIEPYTGHVKAYVGGTNFRYFKYDMAKQGKRQVGSTIKPFIYTFAIDHLGYTPCTRVPNLPVTIEAAGGTAWSPKESGKVEYDGYPNPLYWGLALSRNNYSAWVMKQAKQPAAVADFIHNMGMHSYIDPVPALALGTSESNPYELAGAYATFASQGVFTEPMFVTRIEDRQGNTISTFTTTSQDAINKTIAETMLGMLRKVVTNGTARRLNWAHNMTGVEIAGKTGTSQNSRDAWFVGVTPNIVAAAWVGGEDQMMHMEAGGEGSVMALPIVGRFLETLHKNPASGITREDSFNIPANLLNFNCDEDETSRKELNTYRESSRSDEFFD